MNQTYRSLNATVTQSKNCPFGGTTKIELKNTETMPHKNGIWQCVLQLGSVPVLSDITVIFLSSIIALTPNDNFWIVQMLLPASDMTYAAMHEGQFYVDGSLSGLYRLPFPFGYLIALNWAESATCLHPTCLKIASPFVSLRHMHLTQFLRALS